MRETTVGIPLFKMQKKSRPDRGRLIGVSGSAERVVRSSSKLEAYCTTWSNAEDVLLAELASPRY